MELGDWVRCFSFVLLAFCALSYVGYSLRKRTELPWRELAVANNLTYTPGLFFLGQSGFVTGIYRGYYLELETGTSTRITLSAHNPTNSRRLEREIGLMVESFLAADPLRVFTVSQQLQVQIKGGPDPVIVRYEQDGSETDTAYLQSIFDLLGDMADAYCFALALEGKAIPILEEIARDNKNELQPIIIQLFDDIAKNISLRLGDSNDNLLCLDCLTHYKRHKANLAWLKSFTFYGCRICYGSQKYFEGKKVIAMLDREMDENPFQQDEELWINWLALRTLFDFDEVNIIRATDEDVERFAVQVGNDTDPFRKPRYQQMPCFIASDCDLSENTKRILQQMLGQVVAKESNPRP